MKKQNRKLGKRLVFAAASLAVTGSLLLGYMHLEYKNIKVTHLALGAQDERLQGLKIVYAVDFQYDMQNGRVEGATFQKAVENINAQQPDLVLLGGDYVSFSSNRQSVVPYLAQLQAPLGVYGVFGNHDAYSRDFLKKHLSNIRFLENETVSIPYNGTSLAITGVEDFWTGTPYCTEGLVEEGQYGILLTHNPDFFEMMNPLIKSRYALTLAGHIHAGQITFFGIFGVPFVLQAVTDYGEKYRYGEKYYEGNRIYISSGLGGGVENFAVRFGATPEIVVLES